MEKTKPPVKMRQLICANPHCKQPFEKAATKVDKQIAWGKKDFYHTTDCMKVGTRLKNGW